MEYIYIYLMISLLLCLGIASDNNKIIDALLLFVWFVSFPVGSIVVFAFLMLTKDQQVGHDNMDEEVISHYKYEIKKLDTQIELNLLPIYDSLFTADNNVKREQFFKIMKKNISEVGNYIVLALKNEDSETAHYAAAHIQGSKNKIDIKMKYYKKMLKQDKLNISIIREYCDFIIESLNTQLNDQILKKIMEMDYLRYSQKLSYIKNTDEKYITFAIKIYIQHGDYEEAKYYSELYFSIYPDTIQKYLISLELYYAYKDKYNFHKILTEFRNTDLVFDKYTLGEIRFWLGDSLVGVGVE